METLKKMIMVGRWGIMSIPLVEIKVDMIDPTLLYSTLMERSWPLWKVQRSPRHPKVLVDLVSKTLWWVLVVPLTGSPRMCAPFLATFTSYLTLLLAPLCISGLYLLLLHYLSCFTVQVTGVRICNDQSGSLFSCRLCMCVHVCFFFFAFVWAPLAYQISA